MERLVTIKTFTYAHEAAVARSLLASEGIFCFLKDELTIQANPFYSNALGGVKLQVREGDFEHAAAVLTRTHVPDVEPISIKTASGAISECPACESEELALVRKPSGVLYGLSLLLLGFPLPFFSKVYHCYNCGRDIRVAVQR